MAFESLFIVVTGASRGLGYAAAVEFARLGHRVAGCGRSEHPKKGCQAPFSYTSLDVVDAVAVSRWAKQLTETMGTPNLILNNAALINQNAPLWKVPVEEFSKVVDVNIKGMFHVIRAFLPSMLQKKNGVIVNFSSGWGRSTDAEVAPYCATKWAVEGLTQALAQELPEPLAAVPLNPGIIDTEMLRSCFGGSAGAYPTSEQWAKRAVPFLLRLSRKDNGVPLTAP